ncbi:MAG: hypothetical protein MR704_09045 [Clostridia bacterium]|nr:hypothetical protein [Clostridia bacterium]
MQAKGTAKRTKGAEERAAGERCRFAQRFSDAGKRDSEANEGSGGESRRGTMPFCPDGIAP